VQVKPGDTLLKIAWRAGITLDALLLDNVDNIKSLDASITGVMLLLCDTGLGERGKTACFDYETEYACLTLLDGSLSPRYHAITLSQQIRFTTHTYLLCTPFMPQI
jgi:hypothetical protein